MAERTFRNLMEGGDSRHRPVTPTTATATNGVSGSPAPTTHLPPSLQPLSPSRTASPPTVISQYAAKLGQWGIETGDLASPPRSPTRERGSSGDLSNGHAYGNLSTEDTPPLSPLNDYVMSRFLTAAPAELAAGEDLSPIDHNFVPGVEDTDPVKLFRALMRACSNGDAVRVRNILESPSAAKMDVNQRDGDGVTALCLASCFGHTEAVHELLLHGANPDAPDKDNWTPLIWAANNRHPSVVRILLSYNASVNEKTSRGRTVRDFIGEDPTLRHLIEGAAADEPDPDANNNQEGHIGDGSFEDGINGEKIEFSDDEGTVISALTAISVNGTPAFDYTKCLPDQMFVFGQGDIPRMMEVLVRKVQPARVRRGGAGEKGEDTPPVPANVIFLAARYAHYYHGGDLMENLLDAAGQHICVALNEYRDDLNHLAHWLSQITQLLYYLKKDVSLAVATATFQARFAELCGDIYLMIVRNSQKRLALILEECMLQHEPVPLQRPYYDGRRGGLSRRMRLPARTPPKGMFSTLASSGGRQFPQASPTIITNILNSILFVLRLQKVHRTTVHQVFRQIFAFLNAWSFNLILDTPEYCCRFRAVQIGLNFSNLEEWLRGNAGALPERKLGLLGLVQPTLRMLQLLQIISTCRDLPSFLEVQSTFLDASSGISSPNPTQQAAPKSGHQLTMFQIRRALAQYRYESGEEMVGDEVEQYVELCCVRMGERAKAEMKHRVPGASGNGSGSDDESRTPISSSVSRSPIDEDDPLRDRFDPEVLLPFKMVALSRSDGNWSGSVGKSVARVPLVPEEVLALLDSREPLSPNTPLSAPRDY